MPHNSQNICSGSQDLCSNLTSHPSQRFGVFLSAMPADIDPATLAWYADPDFVAARNHIIPPGGRSAYSEICLYFSSLQGLADRMVDESPPQGSVPEDVTEFIYGMSPVHISVSMSLLKASPSTTISPTSKELSMMWALWRVPAAGRPRLQESLDVVESTFGICSLPRYITLHQFCFRADTHR